MQHLTDVVKNLLIINILVYFGTSLPYFDPPTGELWLDLVNGDSPVRTVTDWGRLQFALFGPTSVFFRPYQLVTHMFMHADLTHLLFNMFAVYMFGPPLEALLGKKKFFIYYFFTAIGALVLHLLVKYLEINFGMVSPNIVNVPMLGASGAVFGLLAGFGMKFPEQRIMLLFPPIPMKAKYFVMIYAAIELFLGVAGFNTGIAHFAHLGGGLFGFLLLLYWQKNGSRL